jgi:arylsulfatase A-like enzyme
MAQPADRKPNILLITSDQQRGDCYGFRGRKVKTPHLDRLAENGVDFRNCITPSPVCQPARATILTGLLPFSNGAADNGIDLDPTVGEQGFAGQLSAAGYETGLIGKAHFSTKATFAPTGRAECERSSADFPADWTGPYMGFGHVELALFGKWFKGRPPLKPPHGQHFEKWFFDVVGGDEGYALWAAETRKGVGANQTWSSALPVAWHASSWIGDRSLEFLKTRDRSKPFLLWTSFGDPHHPFDCPEPWASLHHPDEVDIAEHRELDLDRRPWWHRATLEGVPNLSDPILKKFRTSGTRILEQSEAQLREMTANYYGMISLIDHNVGRLLVALDELGELDNTYILYTSDHGDLLGDHGLYLKGPTLYESLLNVGMIAAGPGVPKGVRNDALISTLDLAATFCEIAGTSLPPGCQAQSFLPLIGPNYTAAEGRDSAFCEWRVGDSRCGVELRLSCIRTADAKLTLDEVSGAGEMYDLVNDPNEMNNIFDDPAAAKMRKRLNDIRQARDGLLLHEFDEPVGMT